ncbi:MAG TPA: hypothetical protein V6D28_04765 [Leptolyngbyaceae cyanobacterium]
MNNKLKFEILAIDTGEQSFINSEKTLLYAFLSNGALWKTSASMDEQKMRITDGDLVITTKRVKVKTENDAELINAFIVTATGNYDCLKLIRELIVKFINHQRFDKLYILEDQVSARIAQELYPLIYRVENILRAYIVKFMTTRLGTKWWEDTATKDLTQKVQNRNKDNKNEEESVEKYTDNNAYEIDFPDLGKLIYSHSSGFNTKEDILRKISQLEETPEAIRRFKEELKSNYQKFFKESFKDKSFQEKWESLQKIRNKVAHNKLFKESDFENGKKLSEELIEIIATAIQDVDEVTLRLEEVEAIQESFAAQGSFSDITEIEFIEELKQQEEYYSQRPNGFVSLSKFIKVNLVEDKNYSESSARRLLEELKQQGKVDVYYVDNPINGYRTAAVKIVQQSVS